MKVKELCHRIVMKVKELCPLRIGMFGFMWSLQTVKLGVSSMYNILIVIFEGLIFNKER